MVMGRRSAYCTVVTLGFGAYALSAAAILWVAPRELGVGTPGAYSIFHDGSLSGIWFFTTIWTLWSGIGVALVLVRLKGSDAWVRRGRHRFISLVGSALLACGLIATASWMPFVQVDLAIHNVIPNVHRDGSTGALFKLVWAAGACAILAALILGTIGALIDRTIGKAPLLAAA